MVTYRKAGPVPVQFIAVLQEMTLLLTLNINETGIELFLNFRRGSSKIWHEIREQVTLARRAGRSELGRCQRCYRALQAGRKHFKFQGAFWKQCQLVKATRAGRWCTVCTHATTCLENPATCPSYHVEYVLFDKHARNLRLQMLKLMLKNPAS